MAERVSKRESLWSLCWALAIVGLTCLPYLVAWRLAPDGTHYTGLLLNPSDGESYYAKMQQGARGDWLFRLPFTSEPHDGAFVYTFYLALGHLAGWLESPVPGVYHFVRVAAGLFLLLVAYRFIARFLEKVPSRRATFLLLGVSAGFGWLFAPLRLITADLWVAEGFTFLSLLINPHFPLAMALMLLLFIAVIDLHADGRGWWRRIAGAAGAALTLALVHPIAVPVTLVVLGVYLLLLVWRDRKIPWREIAGTGAAGAAAAPVLVYVLVAFSTHPILAAWADQNRTPSLPPWDYALGYGLVLILALGGMAVALRRRQRSDLFLVAWVGSVAILLYLPFALQRRFITGLHVPLALLAGLGLEQIVWPRIRPQRRALVTGLIVGFTALTSLFVPLLSVIGVSQGWSPLVMSNDEASACAWLRDHTAWTDTVLTPPETGQFIPAWAGNRVVYGHPFETLDAETKKAEVAHFFSPEATADERRTLLEQYGVRYVLTLSAEIDLNPASLDLTPIWSQGEATLYRTGASP